VSSVERSPRKGGCHRVASSLPLRLIPDRAGSSGEGGVAARVVGHHRGGDRGSELRHLGRREEAEELWKKALSLLDRMTEADWRIVGTHTESGRYGTEDWLKIYAAHAHNHASQIRRLREALS